MPKWHPPPELVGPFWPGLSERYNENAGSTVRLHSLYNRPATEAVDDMASSLATIIHSSFQVALETCSTRTVSFDQNLCHPRSESQKYSLTQKLGLTESTPCDRFSSNPPLPAQWIAWPLSKQNLENQPLCRNH